MHNLKSIIIFIKHNKRFYIIGILIEVTFERANFNSELHKNEGIVIVFSLFNKLRYMNF
jgi:hypothetical protein